MQPNIPVPTDNLYKFASLFGLVLIAAAMAGFVVVYNNAYSELVQLSLDSMQLGDKEDELSSQMRTFLQKRIDIAASNRDTYMGCIVAILSVGLLTSLWGFERWRHIQPLHDELLELQVAKARKEVHGDLKPKELLRKEAPTDGRESISARYRRWRSNRNST